MDVLPLMAVRRPRDSFENGALVEAGAASASAPQMACGTVLYGISCIRVKARMQEIPACDAFSSPLRDRVCHYDTRGSLGFWSGQRLGKPFRFAK